MGLEQKFTQPCTFIKSVQTLKDLSFSDLPEIAFAGRSNVGKSSLLNALTGQTSLARTSNTPGRTQQLNFFRLGHQCYLVDMPGYGYAKASKSKVSAWISLLKNYLGNRSSLRRVFLLIDSRHSSQKNDLDMMKLLDECGIIYQIVLTKIDKISDKAVKDLQNNVEKTLIKHPAAYPYVLSTSAKKKIGLEEIRASIDYTLQLM